VIKISERSMTSTSINRMLSNLVLIETCCTKCYFNIFKFISFEWQW